MSAEDDETAKARRRRSIAIALGLVALVILFYTVTMVRMGGGYVERPL